MSSLPQRMPLGRLIIEGTVIVFSILLAFAIDAWWDGRQEEDAQIERLARVAAELQSNSERIQSKIETLDVAISATSEILSWMGPEPQEVELQTFMTHWNRMIAIGTFSLIRSATEDFLASGTVDSSQSDDIRNSLSEWYFFGDNLKNQYDLLREAHSKLDDYTYTLSTAPRLHTMSELSVMQDHPRSKFPFDHYALLADPRVENLLAVYLLRMEFVTRGVNSYQERQANLLSSINSAIENWQ